MPLTLAEVNSLTLTLELVCGGELNSDKTTGSTESESEIEETAVATDWLEQKSSLEVKNVERLKLELQMVNGTQLSANKTLKVTESSLKQPKELTCQSQALKYSLDKMKETMMMRPLTLTMSSPILKLESTKEVLDNLQTTVTTPIQPQMLSETSSLTPTPVLANGGKFNSTNNTGSIESRS